MGCSLLTRLAIASFAVALAKRMKISSYQLESFRAYFERAVKAIGYVDYVCGDSAFTAAGRAKRRLNTRLLSWVRRITASAFVIVVTQKLIYHVFGVCIGVHR